MTDLEKLDEFRLPRHSWNYEHLPAADHWFLLAHAYADSSIVLFERMIRDEIDDSFHHAKVAAALLEHAAELFLKAALVLYKQPIPKSHALDQLLVAARKVVPSTVLQFAGEIDDLVRQQPEALANQYLRYPSDAKGEPWAGHTNLELTLWYKQSKLLRDDFARLEKALKAATPLGDAAPGSDV